MGNLTGKSPLAKVVQQVTLIWLIKVAKKNLDLVFIDKEGRWYPLDEVDHEDLAAGLEKISKEVAKRLQLVKEQR